MRYACALLSLLLVACHSPLPTLRVAIAGDSISFVYPWHLTQPQLTVESFAAPGSTASIWATGLMDALVAEGPFDVCVFMVGTNDTAFFPELGGTPVMAHTNQVALAVSQASAGCGHVALMQPPLLVADPVREARLAEYRAAQRGLCDVTPGLTCGPDFSRLFRDRHYGPDLVHPSPEGDEFLAHWVGLELRRLAWLGVL